MSLFNRPKADAKPDAAPARRPADARRSPAEGADSKKLIVGRDISLNGEISACQQLLVEGTVQASLSEGDHIEIAETGLYKGTATVREAIIRGRFEGELTAQRCVVSDKGLITGTLTYSVLEVEAGGVIKGTMNLIGDEAAE
jgi:cytoskeletal protein CcmA (bactofilin family)